MEDSVWEPQSQGASWHVRNGEKLEKWKTVCVDIPQEKDASQKASATVDGAFIILKFTLGMELRDEAPSMPEDWRSSLSAPEIKKKKIHVNTPNLVFIY